MQSMLAHRAEQGFQSTLPVRGATRSLLTWKQRGCISIHAPRAGSDDDTKQEMERAGISIHAPRAGSDSFFSSASRAFVNFNPRSPCGERQPYLFSTLRAEHISIHAPRAGSDEGLQKRGQHQTYFNPRSPCGERRTTRRRFTAIKEFQSTLPVRGATDTPYKDGSYRLTISIHAPRAGSDEGLQKRGQHQTYFNPRSPCGERPFMCLPPSRRRYFNPRSPCGERPLVRDTVDRAGWYFNPRSPCGERP